MNFFKFKSDLMNDSYKNLNYYLIIYRFVEYIHIFGFVVWEHLF